MLDPLKRKVMRAGKVVELSNKEFSLLEYRQQKQGPDSHQKYDRGKCLDAVLTISPMSWMCISITCVTG
ncbi:MAG: hypothetical protein MZV64_34525 [Ignavibacteriales bacterium]|nr:hypothetical protein [Ignavibacteriales bacterium]